MEKRTKSTYLIYLAVISVNFITYSTGTSYSWTSPIIPKLINPDETPLSHTISTFEQSWLASLLSLSAAFSPILAGISSDKFGRKRTLLVFALPMLMAQIIFAFSTSIYLYLFARLLWGFGDGCVFSVLPNYVGEIAEDHNRGLLGCIMAIILTLGTLSSYVIGPYVNIQTFSFINMIPISLFLIIFGIFMPETPYYLIADKNFTGAEESLRKLRNKNETELKNEMSYMSKCVEESMANKAGILDLFKSRGIIRGLIISNGLMMIQQCSGISAVLGYMQLVFDAAGNTIPPELSVILIGVIQWITTIIVCQIVERLGRRLLLLISVTGMFFSLSILGLYFYLQTNQYNVSVIWWLPIASLIVFIITYNLGLGSLPWVIMGELFPSSYKSAASTFTAFVCLFLAFLITVFFPHIAEFIGMAGSFWLFSGFCALGFVFIYFIIIETTGKSFKEIQDILNR